jgi:hypothetical protein
MNTVYATTILILTGIACKMFMKICDRLGFRYSPTEMGSRSEKAGTGPIVLDAGGIHDLG